MIEQMWYAATCHLKVQSAETVYCQHLIDFVYRKQLVNFDKIDLKPRLKRSWHSRSYAIELISR